MKIGASSSGCQMSWPAVPKLKIRMYVSVHSVLMKPAVHPDHTVACVPVVHDIYVESEESKLSDP